MKICCIFNVAPHYRRDIYLKLDSEFDCKFVVGEKTTTETDIKTISPKELKNCEIIKNCTFIKKPFYWQQNVLKELFHKYDAYLILGEPFCISTWIFILLNKVFFRKQIFFWTHGWYGRENFIKKITKKLFFKFSNGIFVYGNYAKNLMVKERFEQNKIHVIYNSLAYQKQLELRNSNLSSDIYKKHFNNKNFNIIFIGRLTKVKKLDFLLKAISRLKNEDIPTNLTLIGSGAELKKLKELTKELDISENVWFYGECYNETQNANLIYNADVCVSPGNVGLTAIHALMFGCPVITHNNFKLQMPEFEAIKTDETGAFFDFNNTKSLTSLIKTWIKKNKNRNDIRQKCFDEIDTHWNPNYQIEIFKKVLNTK